MKTATRNADLGFLTQLFPAFTVRRVNSTSLYRSTHDGTPGGKTILIWHSYRTPIAVRIGDVVYVTQEKYSCTTSKHVNQVLSALSSSGELTIQRCSEDNLQALLTPYKNSIWGA